MQEALRTYLELAMGVTDASRKRVRKVVKEAVGRSGATADQIKTLTADLMATNSANREALAKLVRFEVDRALGVVGLATADEVGDLTGRVRDLERQLREAENRAAGNGSVRAPARSTAATTPRSGATKSSPAKSSPAKASPAKASPAKPAASPSRTSTSRTSTSKGSATKGAPVKKTTKTTKTTARKAGA